MTEEFDYSAYEAKPEEQLGDNSLARLRGLAQELVDGEARIASLQQQLAEANAAYNDTRLKRLPDLMDELEIPEITLPGGVKVKMDTEIRAGIKDEHKEKAHKWLEDNDNGNLIKRQVTIDFSKEEEGWAKKFMRDCAQRKKKLNLKMKKTVHNGTLTKFVKESLADGVDLPQDLFGVFRQRFAKVTVPKK